MSGLRSTEHALRLAYVLCPWLSSTNTSESSRFLTSLAKRCVVREYPNQSLQGSTPAASEVGTNSIEGFDQSDLLQII